MAYQNIILEHAEPGIYVLTVNRPQALNALNGATLDELGHASKRIAADTTARALLITGTGQKAFVAGADIGAMQNMTALEGIAFSEAGNCVMRDIETLAVPTIALVNGYALGGGCELALACDWIIAAENAVFGQPEVSLGIPPGFGGTQRLARRLGYARAVELIVTGQQLKADEALRLGLVNHVVSSQDLMVKGLETARTIAAKAPVAVRVAKRALQRGMEMTTDNGCVLESSLFGIAFATSDRSEGMSAFLEKRAPKFEGR